MAGVESKEKTPFLSEMTSGSTFDGAACDRHNLLKVENEGFRQARLCIK